ncbi:rhomboid family intramembrane serine protease [Actinophytocola algeriensis]|uniref:Membrane associated rhomboid family serine protease n=1 Tax=Actinophytocola algeriensis TaxID=1768010 RepID=A0A7W7PZM7_9PSEU|nr:rhomboid family intramembrane serine protease [Actinophytocola algeriensis]MBB4904266.1 membrane associated rhomboid family serine protease [Actinophytocola algeriensis]MBE1476876.1 membrane associated rhomboid family serine protease [Actinophytocola algeriensis]
MSTLPAPAQKPKNPVNRILPPRPLQALIVIGSFTVLLYLIEIVDAAMSGRLDQFGIQPRAVGGLDGILWAPLLHHGWGHLLANTLPVLVFGFLAMSNGVGQWAAVTLTVWLFSGIGVWLIGADGTTIGASGIAFGWLAFLLVRGIFNRAFGQILVAVVLFLYWGSTLLGVLPGNPGVSWQAHLFGAIGGILAAWLVSMANRATRSESSTPASAA